MTKNAPRTDAEARSPETADKAPSSERPAAPRTLRSMLSFSDRIDLLIRVVLAVAVSIGCYFIIKPFLTAIIIAAILAVVTWPMFARARSSMGGSTAVPAAMMVFLLIVGVLIPTSFLLIALAQQIPKGISVIRQWISSGFTIPPAIADIPGIGPWLHEQLLFAIDPASLSTTMQKLLEPLSAALLNVAFNISNILMQLALVTFIVFFFYRDGAWFADRTQTLMKRVSGNLSSELTKILVNTTRSVVFGLVGTALGQAVVAGIGFWIAGVPGILMLCTLVFVLSIVPIGPPLVWGPAAIWLYTQGETGMAVFLVLWGLLAVSSVDNFIKPILIARGSSLPLGLIFLGVFGGVIAFGFLGLILGPILLAVGVAMLQAWLKNPMIAAKLDAGRAARSRRAQKRDNRPDPQSKGNSLDKAPDTSKVP